MNTEKKIRIPLWIYPSVVKKIEDNYERDNCKSPSEFIEKAILFYCGYLTAGDYKTYFPNVIVSTIKGNLSSLEDRIASLLFKIAVELSMMLHVTAVDNDIDETSLEKLRILCVNEVRRIHGSIKLEDAVKFQNRTD